jgi:HlyD family secretion protein
MNRPEDNPPPAAPAGTLGDRVRSLRLGDREGGSRNRLPWVLCFLLLGSTLAFGYQAFRKPRESAPPEKGPPKVDEKSADSGDVVLQAKGYIVAAHPILVSPQVGGKVESLHIEEGMRVNQGQILAQLEVIEYEAKYRRALAKYESARLSHELSRTSYPEEVARARLDVEEAKADMRRTQDQLERAERLPPLTQSREEVQKLRNEFAMLEARARRKEKDLTLSQVAKLRVTTAEAEMEAARADMDEARWRLDNCTVLAPVSGTILTKDAEESNLVNAAAFNVTAKICQIADLSDLEVDLSIQERDIARIVVGQECLVVPEAFQNNKPFLALHPKGYPATVSRLMPIADRAKGAIPVRVRVPVPRDEEGVYLKPDMGVIVSFKKVDGRAP